MDEPLDEDELDKDLRDKIKDEDKELQESQCSKRATWHLRATLPLWPLALIEVLGQRLQVT